MSTERIHTFVIADIRGHSRFTEEYEDEAAARLTAKFTDIIEEVVDTRGGRVVEIRGDEALTVFASARQGIRAAMDLQRLFAEETDADRDLPLVSASVSTQVKPSSLKTGPSAEEH